MANKRNDQKKQDLYHVNRQTDLQWLETDEIITERQAKGPASDVVWNPVTRRMELLYEQATK